MEQKAVNELEILFREAIQAGGAPIEMRARRFVSFVRNGDPELAQALMGAVTASTGLRRAAPTAVSPVDQDSKLQLLRETSSVQLDGPPILAEGPRVAIERLLNEQRKAERLLAENLHPIRSLLLSGPPGVGKSMTAAWIAQQLNLPLLTLDLASVMSSYLGRTGSNLKSVLEHANQRRCVLLLDEFDAIAKRRNDDSDVGELKRLVTVLLQAIDDWSYESVLVAATNHGELLDPAVWRRFDLTVELHLPQVTERARLLVANGIAPPLADLVSRATEGISQALLQRAAQAARKAPFVDGQSVEVALLTWALQQSMGDRKAKTTERSLRILLEHLSGRSAREIADRLDVSHTTVNRTLAILKESEDG